jgi:hypothetical protein
MKNNNNNWVTYIIGLIVVGLVLVVIFFVPKAEPAYTPPAVVGPRFDSMDGFIDFVATDEAVEYQVSNAHPWFKVHRIGTQEGEAPDFRPDDQALDVFVFLPPDFDYVDTSVDQLFYLDVWVDGAQQVYGPFDGKIAGWLDI